MMLRTKLTALALCLLAGVAPVATAEPARPNIIFVLVDDLGYGDLGVFFQNLRRTRNDPAEPWHMTPRLDTLAAEGVRLPHHYCPAPVCAPSRASLLLGVHQGHANVRDNQFDKELENNHTLATVLRGAGYATAAIGKWGLQGGGSGPDWPAHPLNRGFDDYFGYIRHVDGHEHYPKEGLYRGRKEVWENRTEVSDALDKCYTADLWTARAKKLIIDETTNHPDRPFFLYLAYDTPHAALHKPTQAYPAGGGVSGGIQWLGTAGQMINTASGTIDSWFHPDYAGMSWSEGAKRHATCARRIDDCVGDLLQTLQDLGIDDDTMIVFSSDNGPANEAYTPGVSYAPSEFDTFGPFDGIKRDTLEGGIREPTIVRWPGTVPAGQVSQHHSQFHDWMATFADIAGVTVPARCDGVSLLPTLTGVGTQREGIVYVEYEVSGSTPSYTEFDPSHRGKVRGEMQVIVVDGYTGLRTGISSQDNPFEIFDVLADPQETNNLAGTSPYFDELQERMKARVLEVRQPDSSATRPYDSAFVPMVGIPLTPNLDYAAFEGSWPWVPEFRTMTPVATGVSSGLDLGNLTRPTDAGLLFTGYLNIPAEGTWTFKLTCDTGAHLRIHDSMVIDDDYHHTGAQVTGTVKLEQGCHPIRLYYRTGTATPALTLKWSGPGTSEQTIPASAFFSQVQDGSPPAGGITWTGASSQDIFEEGNWDLTESYVTAIDPGVTILDDVLIEDAPQTVQLPDVTGIARLQLGDGYTLTIDNSTVVALANEGIGGAPGTSIGPNVEVTGGAHLEVLFIASRTSLHVGASSSVTLTAGAHPVDDSPVDLTVGATLAFTNESVTEYVAEHLSKTTVDGEPAVVDDNIFVVSDGANGCLVSVVPEHVPYCFGDPGSGTPCPCGNDNDGSVPGSGCANGVFLEGARLSAVGDSSVSADTLLLSVSAVEPNQSGLYFQADNDLSPGSAWGDGLRCAGGSLRRLGVRFADWTGSSNTSGFPLSISAKAGNVTAGDTKYYQCWYRNPTESPCLTDFNLSNGVAVSWWP